MRKSKVNLIILVLTIFIIQFSILNSQDTWLHTYDPFYEAIFSVEDVIVCSDGGYAVNGTCIDQETTIGWGFVIKTDSNGNLLWAKKDTVTFQFENASQAIVETQDGGIISVSYHYTNGTAMIKRDTNGNREWAILLEDVYISSMDNSNDNNIISAGVNNSTGMIAKFNENGEVIWSNDFSISNSLWSVIQSVRATNDNCYLLSGRVKFEETEDAALVIKVDSNGDSLWTKIYDITNLDERANTILEIEESNIIVGGYIENVSGFLWKLDSEGNTLWIENGTENCGYEITSFTKSNDESIIALFGDPVFNNGIKKFDNEFNLEWSNDLPYFNGNGDKAVTIIQEGNIIVALKTSSTAALTKLNPDGTDIYNDIAIFPNPILETYPNPFKTTISFSFSLNKTSNMEINVYNLKGQLIYKIKEGFLNYGKHTVCWQSLNLNSGIYFVQLQANNEVLDSKKITLIK